MIPFSRRTTAGIFFLIAATVAGIYGLDFLPTVRLHMKNNISDKIVAVTAMAVGPINRAVKEKDDVLLLIQIQNLAHMDDIAAAYILDADGKILIHDRTSEWGQKYTDTFHRTAITKRKPLIQKSSSTSWLYSIPLQSSATLCMVVSSQKIDTALTDLKKRTGYTAGALIFIVAIAIMLLFRRPGCLDTTPPLNTEIFNAPIEIASNTRADILIQSLVALHAMPMMVLNAENRISAIHPQFASAFGLLAVQMTGKHIIDVLPHPVIAELMHTASAARGTEFSERFNEKTLYCIAVGTKTTPAGTLFFLK